MRTALTILLALLAFTAGVVAAGVVGDQGRGLDLTPFVAGALAALAVVVLRTRRPRDGGKEAS